MTFHLISIFILIFVLLQNGTIKTQEGAGGDIGSGDDDDAPISTEESCKFCNDVMYTIKNWVMYGRGWKINPQTGDPVDNSGPFKQYFKDSCMMVASANENREEMCNRILDNGFDFYRNKLLDTLSETPICTETGFCVDQMDLDGMVANRSRRFAPVADVHELEYENDLAANGVTTIQGETMTIHLPTTCSEIQEAFKFRLMENIQLTRKTLFVSHLCVQQLDLQTENRTICQKIVNDYFFFLIRRTLLPINDGVMCGGAAALTADATSIEIKPFSTFAIVIISQLITMQFIIYNSGIHTYFLHKIFSRS